MKLNAQLICLFAILDFYAALLQTITAYRIFLQNMTQNMTKHHPTKELPHLETYVTSVYASV